jgi:hypothetical protein
MILNDIDLLNEDLNEIGLYAYKGTYHSINIDIIGYKIPNINISYDMAYTYKALTSGYTIRFNNGFDCISCYIKSANYKTKYENIKDIASSLEFKSLIRNLYEKSLKK